MIAIVNTGGANLASIACACERLGAAFQITLDSDAIRAASHVILPGVGAARDAMIKITANGLNHFLPTRKQPVLGICLGMQLFYQHSAEGDTPCLGILPGVVRRITPRPGVIVPHMGWNTLVDSNNGPCPLANGLLPDSHVYFVHSYMAPSSAATKFHTVHGEPIPAIVARGNFFGTQFHPERSGAVGAAILRNFLQL